MVTLLEQAVAQRLLRPLDVRFARMLAEDSEPQRLLAAACLSAEAGAGHACLPLGQLQETALFAGQQPVLAQAIWSLAGRPTQAQWHDYLAGWSAVSDGSHSTPLVLQQDRLYLQRMWQSEGEVAQFIAAAARNEDVDEEALRAILDRLFDARAADELDWQKVAAAVAATRRLAVISGGPGTGKTTTVAKLLAALVQLAPAQRLRIQLTAPTGKAAARLTASLGEALRSLGLSAEQRALFPQEAATLHRLLGAQPHSQRLRYHRDNPLHLDVLVVDEASMVDLPMMARLIAALPPQARVILLGDRDQLASVEVGAVLGDICRFAEQGYSEARAQQLSRLTGYPLPSQHSLPGSDVSDSLCLLRKSYRFAGDSGIGRLAQAVNAGQPREARQILQAGYQDLAYYPLAETADYAVLLRDCVAGYCAYLQLVASGAEHAVILMAFGRFQLLCALREGPFGVTGLNERIEQALQRSGLISRSMGIAGRWYAGRPIMMGRNDSALGLFNGDIGITLFNEQGELRVYFQLPDGSIRSVQPSRLPEHETAYAMTVHKSQGSEFEHTVLVLPSQVVPVLSRELLYTAITRARQRLSLYCTEPVLNSAIGTPTLRRSGLTARLMRPAEL